jgi:2-polyprenyl-3-methyl-5-hydroxy-6-metoxy-1,4-benzoquinol methylase
LDFRTRYYDHYVSQFKKGQLTMSENWLKSYQRWTKYKYFPFLAGVNSDSRVLEIGCGPGYFMTLLADEGFNKVEGIDISQEQIDIAIQRGCNARVADVFDYLRTKTKQFDVIIGIDFLEHFTKDELSNLLPLLFDSMKDGGRAIFQVPNGQGIFVGQILWGDMTHLTIFTPESLTQILTMNGFTEIVIKETGPIPRGIVGCLRTILWKGIRGAAYFAKRIETGKAQRIWTENMICCCRK